MRRLYRLIVLPFLCLAANAQGISGAGQFGCNSVPVTGTAWTSATALNTTQTLGSQISGAQVIVTLDQTTTITAGAVTLQEDPGDGNLVTLNTWQLIDPTTPPFATLTNPYTLQASTNKQFLVLMGAAYKLVLKLSTAITGTGSITPYTTVACYQMPLAFQATASNLLTSAAQSGSWSVGLNAGSQTIGAVTQASGPWSSNMTQVGGTAINTSNGTSSAGDPRINIASDNSAIANWGQGATGSAVPANAVFIAGKGSGNLLAPTVCDNWTNINVTANTQLITGTASKQSYICSINIVVGAATNVAIVEGTGTTCGTGTAAVPGTSGGSTAATGWNFSANGGIAQGNDLGAIARTATAADNVCILVSAANQVSGGISWTQY